MNIQSMNYLIGYTRQRNMQSIAKKGTKAENQNKKNLLLRDSYQKKTSLIASLDQKAGQKSSSLSKLMLDALNFDYSSFKGEDGVYKLNNIRFTADQIPDIDKKYCKEIKAVDNVVSFENGSYYRYKDSSGKAHVMACVNSQLGTSFSDELRGIVDHTNNQRALFWNMLAKDGTYLDSHFSKSQQKSMLSEAGITKGFFTVKAGKSQQSYFLSNGNSGTAIDKERYEATFRAMTQTGGLFEGYEPGTTVSVNGKNYTLSEQGTIDVAYGEDIFDVSCSRK